MKKIFIISLSILLLSCALSNDYYTIKDVYIQEFGTSITYGFAGTNALNEGIIAYCNKMKIPYSRENFSLSNNWIDNSAELNNQVKSIMETGSYTYSFTYLIQSGYYYLIINRRVCGDNYEYTIIVP